MQAVTVIIPTLNEEKNLKELLPLVRWVDEIIVIDSFSNDETVSVAKSFGAKVLQRIYKGPSDQKNWAIEQAKNEWILLFDADERPTKELTEEVQLFLSEGHKDSNKEAFWIKRQNFFLDKKINYSGWQGDAVIRLFKKATCRYNHKQVHEEIETSGNIGVLKQRMLHYTYKDLNHFLDKMRRYAAWSAEDYRVKTARIGFFHLVLKPLFRFVKHYIVKRGFLDGKAGLIISVLMAWGVFLRYAFLVEERRNNNKKHK